MSTDMQTPEVGNSEKDGLLQEWKERAEKAERNAAYWKQYANDKDASHKTYYEMRLCQEIERAEKAESALAKIEQEDHAVSEWLRTVNLLWGIESMGGIFYAKVAHNQTKTLYEGIGDTYREAIQDALQYANKQESGQEIPPTVERAQKAEAENKRLRELLENAASLLGEFEADFNNAQITIQHWQRQHTAAKQREAVKEAEPCR